MSYSLRRANMASPNVTRRSVEALNWGHPERCDDLKAGSVDESSAARPRSKTQRAKALWRKRPRFGLRQCSAASILYQRARYAPRFDG
jgi:hypothetical protein